MEGYIKGCRVLLSLGERFMLIFYKPPLKYSLGNSEPLSTWYYYFPHPWSDHICFMYTSVCQLISAISAKLFDKQKENATDTPWWNLVEFWWSKWLVKGHIYRDLLWPVCYNISVPTHILTFYGICLKLLKFCGLGIATYTTSTFQFSQTFVRVAWYRIIKKAIVACIRQSMKVTVILDSFYVLWPYISTYTNTSFPSYPIWNMHSYTYIKTEKIC